MPHYKVNQSGTRVWYAVEAIDAKAAVIAQFGVSVYFYERRDTIDIFSSDDDRMMFAAWLDDSAKFGKQRDTANN